MFKFFQKMKGAMTPISDAEAEQDFGDYLLKGEQITMAYRTVRDRFAITSSRLIIADHQGATGKRLRIVSIPLGSIYDVAVEKAGFGIESSEIIISYITTPQLTAYGAEYGSYTLEFPGDADISKLYRFFAEQAHATYKKLNG